jgi:hypothetical protein
MRKYNPMVDPVPQLWQELDADERIEMVRDYHQQAGIDIPDEYMHALLHVVVENQIALGMEIPTQAVLRRLIDENLDRHDAIHAIASVLANHMYELMNGDDPVVSNEDYYAELENLTAKKWLRGDYSDG